MARRAVPGMLERVLALWPGLRWRLGILRALLVSAAAAQTIPVLGSSRTPAEPSIAQGLLQQVGPPTSSSKFKRYLQDKSDINRLRKKTWHEST